MVASAFTAARPVLEIFEVESDGGQPRMMDDVEILTSWRISSLGETGRVSVRPHCRTIDTSFLTRPRRAAKKRLVKRLNCHPDYLQWH